MQAVNFAPYVNRFDKQEFLSKLTAAGFTIDLEWQPGKETIFVVAKKPI
jgi:hypothetical protein